jgi:cytochrome c biogenesis protein CcmG/thiol:disulfide interchange protein DsbE
MSGSSSTRNRWLLVPVLVFAALAALFLYTLSKGGVGQNVPSALIGQSAPEFTMPAIPGLQRDGTALPGLSRADLIGPVSLVNVFASWCGPCREEHPLLIEVSLDPRIRLVGLNFKDDPDNARRFLGTLGNPYAAIGSDPAGRTAIDWGVYGVPETFVVGRDGTILYKHVGPLTNEAIRGPINAAIEKALKR